MHRDKKSLSLEEKKGREKPSSKMNAVADFLSLFPYDPYPQQLEFMRDIKTVLGGGGILVSEACNGFGKTVCALSGALALGRRIVYATRTHEQVRQVLREVEQINRKTGTDFSAVALASRQNLCLNEICRRLPPIESVEACRVLRQTRRCPYKIEVGYSPSSLPSVLSTRRLLRYGRAKGFCPYFLSRKAAENCTVVVAPYQYIFNEAIRAVVNLAINGKVLIFDEAHNADKIGQEVLSDTLSERGLDNAKRELELLGIPSVFIDDLADYLERNVSEEAVLKPGAKLHRDLKQLLGEDLSFFVDSFMPVVDEIREYKISRGDFPVCYLNGILKFLSLVNSTEREKYVAIYRRSYSGLNLVEYRCLDPSLAIKPVIEEAYAALIMSGTLSPLDLYADVLGLSEAETRTYSAIAKPENVRTSVDTSVTTRFQERNTGMLRLYGERIVRLMKKVPNGALIFFPQRRLMREALELWRKTGLIKKKGKNSFLNEKRVFVEGERASENARIVDEYKKAARSSEGAVLFAVFRGRNAEGSDFPNEEARGIFNIGLPYADYHDPLVKAQIGYFNKKRPRLGDLWYVMDAFKAANQAMGRGIRHRDDWCRFFLMDRRYGTHWKFISKWAVESGIEEVSLDQM
jgi:Rad3-related DNA helicase